MHNIQVSSKAQFLKMYSSDPPPTLRTRTLQMLLDPSVNFLPTILQLPYNSEICVFNSLDLF